MVRRLGLVDVAAIVVGGVVGVGIFFTPASLARDLPSPAWMLSTWVLGGTIALLGALVFADLGGRIPRSGGLYVFLREGLGPGLGPLAAFLYGWINLLVIQPGSLAIVALVLVMNLEFLVGPLPSPLDIAIAMAAIALFAGANGLGLRAGAGVQVAVTATKLLAVGLLVALGVGWGRVEVLAAEAPSTSAWQAPALVAAALIPVVFTYAGWQHGTFVAGSARDPRRTVPWGIVSGVVVVVVCYLCINAAYLALLGQEGMARSQALAAEAAGVALGRAGGTVVAAAIVVSAAGILNTICLAFPWVLHAMAADGLFPARAGALHPRTGTPVVALAALCAWSMFATLLGMERIDVLLAGLATGEWAFFALVAVAHLRLRGRDADAVRFRVPAWVSVLFGLASVGVAGGALAVRPLASSMAPLALLLGIPVYWWWRRR